MVAQRSRFAAVGSAVDLPELENGILDLWRRERTFERLRLRNAGGKRFLVHRWPDHRECRGDGRAPCLGPDLSLIHI